MNRMRRQVKKPLKITCYYKKDGMDAQKLVKQSFRLFVKNGLARSFA